jgi:C-terminal processing protease CtpA/Prc
MRRGLYVAQSVRLMIVFSLCWLASVSWHVTRTAAGDDKGLNFGQRDAAEECVKRVAREVQERYYDPSLHGIDLKTRANEAKERIAKIHTLSEVYLVIEWMLNPLNDSHTFFIPPVRPYDVQHGWEFGFVGDKCYITAVKPDSDAFIQGIRPGDELISLEGFTVTRANSWKLQYAFEGLAPRSAMRLTLRDPEGKPRTTLVNARVEKLPKQVDLLGPGEFFRMKDVRRLLEPRAVEMGEDLMIWKLPLFSLAEGEIDKYVRMAQKHRGLILDLRGNPGGGELVLSRMISRFFDRNLNVGEKVQRNHTNPWTIESKGPGKTFSGKLVVMVDSQSASAAEVLARVIQIENRGLILGDRSSGMVMESRPSYFRVGTFDPIVAGVSVTEGDLRMRDGKSLEHVGVTPDRVVLPSPQDLAAARDPALAAAAAELGVQLTPEEAGKLFPTLWRNL